MPTQTTQPNTQSQNYSVDDFANIIKTKYPAYKNIDNNTLVTKFLAKYPVYKIRVTMAQPVSSLFKPQLQNKSFMGLSPNAGTQTGDSTPQTFSGTNTADIIKGVGKQVINSEVGVGQDIAGALSPILPKSWTGVKGLDEADQAYIQNINSTTAALKLAKSKGKDVTKLESMLKSQIQQAPSNITDLYPALTKSTEQVLGDFGGLAVDVATAGAGSLEGETGKLALDAGSKNTASLAARVGIDTSEKAASTGAKAGVRIAKGAAEGAGYGAGVGLTGGMQQNENPTDLGKSTLIGAGTGLVVGGALNGIFGTKSQSLEQTTQDVSPRLTASEAENTETKTSKVTKKITPVPSKRTIEIANDVHETIKGGKTFSDKANLADKGISTEAESLKSQIKNVDHPVPKRELKSNLRNTERPVLISSDATMNRAYSQVLTKANKIIDSMEGTISGSLDGRKEFDDFVSKQFPNLYESDAMTPMRTAIKNIRNQWNDFIASQLPDNVKFQDSLDNQSSLFDARDVLREKAARGAPKVQGEIGTNRFGRWAKAHPKTVKLAKTGAGIAATSLGVGEVIKH